MLVQSVLKGHVALWDILCCPRFAKALGTMSFHSTFKGLDDPLVINFDGSRVPQHPGVISMCGRNVIKNPTGGFCGCKISDLIMLSLHCLGPKKDTEPSSLGTCWIHF